MVYSNKRKLSIQHMLFLFFIFTITLNTEAAPRKLTVTGGKEVIQSIAIPAFEWMGTGNGPNVDIAYVLNSDIGRSGLLDPIPPSDFKSTPSFGGAVRFATWRTIGADYLVLGRIKTFGAKGYSIEYELFDIYNGDTIISDTVEVESADYLRTACHLISDIIYENLLGRKGPFYTRIAYVGITENFAQKIDFKKQYQLYIADYDGENRQPILTSYSPIMSPVWSPDMKKVAYVSFEKRKSRIYVQNVETRQRRQIMGFRGINGSPSWSPQGDKLAIVLSKDGNPEIYIVDLHSNDMIRLTHSLGIDTEPVWTPDGRNIIFTSDRGGSPQIYSKPTKGGKAKRLTFSGNYNSNPAISPDGSLLTFVHRDSNRNYKIGLLNLHTESFKTLSHGPMDESPTFSPNGDIIIFSSKRKNRMVLKSVSRNGEAEKDLNLSGFMTQPDWGSYER